MHDLLALIIDLLDLRLLVLSLLIFTPLELLFPAHHMPSRMPETYGTDDEIPMGYLQQIAYPFRRTPQRPGGSHELATGKLQPD